MKKKLPKPGTMISYFEGFVETMEDMNVVLGRHDAPDRDIVRMGRFTCEP